MILDTEQFRAQVRAHISSIPDCVVSFNKRGHPKYDNQIRMDRSPANLGGPEELTRAVLVAHIVHDLGYNPNDIKIEHAVRARVGSGREGDKFVDITINRTRDETESVWALVECKPETVFRAEQSRTWEQQLFSLSKFFPQTPNILAYATARAARLGESPPPPPGKSQLLPVFQIVETVSYPDWNLWRGDGEPFQANQLPQNFGKAEKKPLQRGTEHDLRSEATESELRALQKDLHNTLWGGGATSDNDVFNLITRLILAKIQDEQSASKSRPYDFQLFDGENIRRETLPRLDELYRTSLKARLRVSLEEADRKHVRENNRGTDAQLRYAIQQLEQYSFTEIAKERAGGDILGTFFEGILRNGFKQSKGQFFTHPNIVRFCVDVLDIGNWTRDQICSGEMPPLIIDPSAGSGTFLIETMKVMAEVMRQLQDDLDNRKITLSGRAEDILKRLLSQPTRCNEWAQEYIHGLEINEELGLAAQVNMMLHSDGASSILAGVQNGDGLAHFSTYPHDTPKFSKTTDKPDYPNKVNESFDVVLTNPPFSATYTNEDWERYQRDFWLATQGPQNSEKLFLERWFQLLRPGGRLAAVVPNSLLDSKDQQGRKFLMDKFWLRAVVSLPADAFYPYTGTKTSLIFAKKRTGTEDDVAPGKVYFSRATYLGYKRTSRAEEKISKNDLSKIHRKLKEQQLWI